MPTCESPDNSTRQENSRLRAEIERLRALLKEAMDSRAPDYIEIAHPGWALRVRALLGVEQTPQEDGK